MNNANESHAEAILNKLRGAGLQIGNLGGAGYVIPDGKGGWTAEVKMYRDYPNVTHVGWWEKELGDKILKKLKVKLSHKDREIYLHSYSGLPRFRVKHDPDKGMYGVKAVLNGGNLTKSMMYAIRTEILGPERIVFVYDNHEKPIPEERDAINWYLDLELE